jgi:hypothetical protein
MPMYEAATNWDRFRGKKIVPGSKEDLTPQAQTNPYTTWTSRGITGGVAKATGGYLDVSPAKFQHVLDDITGGWYSQGTGAAEAVVQGRSLIKRPELLPVVRKFTLPNDYSRDLDDFYNAAAQSDKLVKTARAQGTLTNAQNGSNQKLTAYKTAINALGDLLNSDPNLSRDERFFVQKYQFGTARAAQGRDPLNSYPSITTVLSDPAFGPNSPLRGIAIELQRSLNSAGATEQRPGTPPPSKRSLIKERRKAEFLQEIGH